MKILSSKYKGRRLFRVVSFLALLLLSFPCFGQEKIKFPISASSQTLGYSPVWVAWKQGFFERQALDVQLVLMSGAEKSLMALVDWFLNQGDEAQAGACP